MYIAGYFLIKCTSLTVLCYMYRDERCEQQVMLILQGTLRGHSFAAHKPDSATSRG